jgi:serine/threonine protein phosphatase PrpC
MTQQKTGLSKIQDMQNNQITNAYRYSINADDHSLILGIYDGHGGWECAEQVSTHLASYVMRHLKSN